MRGVWTIMRRELAGLFLTPLAWFLLAVAVAVNGAFFVAFLGEFGGEVDTTFSFVYGGTWVFWALAAFLPPLLTMRMISEEARTGLLEFLQTAPVSDAAVVTGKFLAATTVMALLWASGLLYALVLAGIGTPPDWGPVLGGYVGAVCVSALFCAVGLLASASTATPLLAAFLAFVVDLVWLLLPLARGATRLEWLHAMIDRFDLVAHFQRSFLLGVLDTAHAVFYLAWTAFFVFLAVRRMEMRRWG